MKDDLLCETYDMASDGLRLYVSLSTSTSMQMATYDGMTWSVGQSQSISGWYPKLYFEQGNVYMLLKPKNTNSKLRLYQYSQDNFQQEGIDIDIVDTSIIDEPKLIYSSGELYVKYVSNNQVKVKKKTMSDSLLSIQVTPPTKVIYNQGEQVDLTGLEVYANYTSGPKKLTNQEYQLSTIETSKIGTHEVTVTYQGKTAKWSYEVKEVLDSISVKLNKTEFTVGDKLTDSDIVITAKYSDGSTKVIPFTDVKVENFDTASVGQKTATITYNGKTSDFTYNVKAAPVPVTLESISTKLNKTEFTVGDKLTDSDIVITAKYSDGSTKVIPFADVKVSSFDTTSVGQKTATITYNGKTVDFTYDVKAVTVPVTLESISAKLNKTEFTVGDELVDNDIVITARYSDGSEKVIPFTDVKVENFDTTSIGSKTASIQYLDQTVTFDYLVINNDSLENDTPQLPGDMNNSTDQGTIDNGTTDGEVEDIIIIDTPSNQNSITNNKESLKETQKEVQTSDNNPIFMLVGFMCASVSVMISYYIKKKS